ncbi:MAG: ABC transporter permease [Bacteroidales bacterium]|nr:ABC transporter permease [Bacteroidales bacterium]MDD4213421.1 ABC transporter permease [Bacteroidales bacterium]
MIHFIGFVKKEFHHIFRDKRTLIILFALPVVQMFLFGYIITTEVRNAHIAILDNSKDKTTRKIIDKLNSSDFFIITKYLNNEKEIENCFRKGQAKEVVIFEPGFAQKLLREKTASVHLIADASDANSANLVINYTAGIINDFIRKENASAAIPVQIIPESRMLYNPELKGVYMFVPGTMAMILVLICALLTSVSIVREKEMGTMEVLLISPLKPTQIIFGKVTPYVLLSIINVITILLMSNFVFGLPVQGSITLLLAECVLFIVLALSMGIFISSMANTQQTAMVGAMLGLMLPTILLSGFIFPIDNMPGWIQWICYINPTTWFIIILKNIMLKGLGFLSVWKETLILFGLTVFLLVVSIKKFKIRLKA